jgi:hypothetical protein
MQLKKLTDLLLKEFISEDEFVIKKQSLKNSILKLKEQINIMDLTKEETLDFTVKAFNFVTKAKESFEN